MGGPQRCGEKTGVEGRIDDHATADIDGSFHPAAYEEPLLFSID
jgi:hypothetical protein